MIVEVFDDRGGQDGLAGAGGEVYGDAFPGRYGFDYGIECRVEDQRDGYWPAMLCCCKYLIM